ncbi:MAG TPA: hypothetical protein VEW48_13600 [Thermoanaerobaculia bacterium]|nr:hypothetical protein [Thermoanaerobaculia bacterium]
MRRTSALIGFCALLAGAVPAVAGEVYVPFASNRSVGGATYQTKVWVTNPSTAARQFSVRFINQNTDGTQGAGGGDKLNVPGGGTLLLGSVAPGGSLGMVEISGAPQLVVNARIDAIGANGNVLSSANVPVVALGNLLKAKSTAHIQGLELTGRGTLSDFGIMNVSNAGAQCTIKAYRSNGNQINQTSIITLLPLSERHFENVLAVLGETAISDARVEVTCDKPFFPYAAVYKPGGPETDFVTSSYALDGDLISGVGGTPGTVVVEAAGIYLNATAGNSFKQYDIPLVDGVRYKKATIEFDLFVDKFPAGIFAGVTSLRRTDRTLFYGFIVRGGRSKGILDMGVTDDIVDGNSGPWKEKTNYHLIFDYDTVTGRLVFKTIREGTLVETLSGPINHPDLLTNGKTMRVDFGMTGIADGAYFPPIGWKYSNLKVTFEPAD